MNTIKSTPTPTPTNNNFIELMALGFKTEIRAGRNGQRRIYLNNKSNERITDPAEPKKTIFMDFYDNKGKSITPETSRENSHLDTALRWLLAKAKQL